MNQSGNQSSNQSSNQTTHHSSSHAMNQSTGDSVGLSNAVSGAGSNQKSRGPHAPWPLLAWMLALAPAMTVVGARLMVGSQGIGPSVAHAAAEVATLPMVPPVVLNDQAKLEAASAAQDQTSTLPWILADAAPLAKEPEVREKPIVPAPEFAVTSIMVARGETIAVVKGRLRRVGDSPLAGWQITQIDAAAGTVTFTHEDGRSEVVALRNRELK